MMDMKILPGTAVSIRLRSGEVVFGKYIKEGRNEYHTIESDDGRKFDRRIEKIKILSSSLSNKWNLSGIASLLFLSESTLPISYQVS